MTISTMDLASASLEQLSFLDSERRWTRGGPRIQGRNHQRIPLDQWYDDRLSAFERAPDVWEERDTPGTKRVGRCLVMSGRGWGKTKTGAEWVRRMAGLYPGCIVHVIAPTYADLRGVIFEGPSGLKAVIPQPCVRSLTYSPYPELVLWNGSVIRGFSSETPDRLRGPQATFVWGDELASWYRAEECLANIDFSTRIAYRMPDGRLVQPAKLYTTTPKPLAWLDKMIKQGVRLVRGNTYENRANLAEDFYRDLEQYEGTQIGRQELHGELLDIAESAIIKKSWLRMWKASDPLPYFEYVMVSMDTAFSEKTYDKKTFASDPTACSVWGVFKYNKKWNLLLLECWEDWLTFPNLIIRAKKEMKAIYGARELPMFEPLVGPKFVQQQVKRPDLLIIEDKGSGISLRQMLDNEGQSSYPYNPGNADKLQRLHMVSHLAHGGRIWLPEGFHYSKEDRTKRIGTGEFASWTNVLTDQLCVYSGPGTTPHDDHVDTCSQAWRVFADNFVSGGVDQTLPDENVVKAQPIPETPNGPAMPDDDDRQQRIEMVDDRGYGGRGAYDG